MTKTYAKTYNFLKKLLLSRNFDKAIKKNTDLIKILFFLKCSKKVTLLVRNVSLHYHLYFLNSLSFKNTPWLIELKIASFTRTRTGLKRITSATTIYSRSKPHNRWSMQAKLHSQLAHFVQKYHQTFKAKRIY